VSVALKGKSSLAIRVDERTTPRRKRLVLQAMVLVKSAHQAKTPGA
jgi:hypothetical protein